MAKTYATLQRRPFLTPIWLSVLGAVAAMAFMSFLIWLWRTADSSIIIVVRQAEKESSGGDDGSLSEAGKAHAEFLARMFGTFRAPGLIDAIYVLPQMRSRLTAAPLATRLGLPLLPARAGDARSLARELLRDHSRHRIMFVGDDATVSHVVQYFDDGAHLAPLEDDRSATLFIVTVPRIGRADFLRLAY